MWKNKKCRAFLSIRNILQTWEMPKKGKVCTFEMYCIPVLMYGVETWTWTKADVKDY
jgi:hypothetical protein